MKKKTMAAVCAVTLISLLAGCYPSGVKAPPDTVDSISQPISDTIGGDENNSDSVETSEAVGDKIPSVTLVPRKWDNKKIIDYFLSGKTISKTSEYESDDFPDEKRYVYDTEDDLRLILERGRITFDNKALLLEFSYGYIQTFLDNSYYEDLNGELASLSKASATDTVTRVLNDIGINNFGEPEIYAVTAADAKKICSNEFEIADWTSDNEVYIMKFPLIYEDVPIIQKAVAIGETDIGFHGSYIDAIVSKDGVISLKLNGIQSEEYQTNESVEIKIGADTAKQKLFDYYPETGELSPPEIIGWHLVYFPTAKQGDTYVFEPYWQFDCMKTGDTIGNSKHTEYVNVHTGVRYY